MNHVLFICIHNSARSQMAEAFLRLYGGGEFEAESAGMEPRPINPLVVEAMAEEGVDLSGKTSKSVFELFTKGRLFDYVVTVCSESVEESCPVFPGVTHRLHLPFPDPAGFTGSVDEKLAKVREVREAIKARIQEFIAWVRGDAAGRLGDSWQMASNPKTGSGG